MTLSDQLQIHIKILAEERHIERAFLSLSEKGCTYEISGGSSSFREKILDWLHSYIERKNPDPLPLLSFKEIPGFQKEVLKFLPSLFSGSTMSYGQVASALRNPKAYRAVGNACHDNPYPLFIPCHRVVSSKGLGGFALDLEIKKRLLAFESNARSLIDNRLENELR